MLLVFGTIFAGLLGLAFGSFLNVCATRWPEDESVVSPRSHCRNCGRTLAWHENIPLASWLALRGRCASCRTWIGWRYPLTELAVGFFWALAAWQTLPILYNAPWNPAILFGACLWGLEKMLLSWLLIGLAVLDAENLWLPDCFTLGGAALGVPFTIARFAAHGANSMESHSAGISQAVLLWILGILIAPGIILFTRWAYFRVRKQHGMGLGDAKLMLLLAVWLGLSHTILAYVLGITFGTMFALVLLLRPVRSRNGDPWALTRLPLGTFLCAGGLISAFWGTHLIDAYLRFAGFLP